MDDKEKKSDIPARHDELQDIPNELEKISTMPALEKAGFLLNHPKRMAIVRKMPSEELHLLIREVEGDEAVDLISLSSPQQIIDMLDLELWDKEYFVEKRFKEWLEILSNISTRKALSILLSMETELLILFLKRSIHVIRRQDDIDPIEMNSESRYTPDNLYYIEFISDDFPREIIEPILDHLYGYDQESFVVLMDHIIMDMESQLEEDAYRFRKGRLEDRGFLEYYEAQDLFVYLDPEKALSDEIAKDIRHSDEKVPSYYPVATFMQPDSFLAKVVKEKSTERVQEKLKWETNYICNQIMMAEKIDFKDSGQIKGAVAVAHNYLNIGLEYLSDGDIDKASSLMEKFYLKKIFRLGYSLTLDLKKRADKLINHWNLKRTDGGIYLFDPEYVIRFAALTNVKPLYYDNDAMQEKKRVRAFNNLPEVKEVESFLDTAATVCNFFFNYLNFKLTDFYQMDFSGCLPEDRREIYFSNLFLTAISRRILGLEPAFDPIPRKLLPKLHQAAIARSPEPELKPEVKEDLLEWLRNFLHESDFNSFRPFAEDCLKILNENFAPVDSKKEIVPEFIKGLIVRVND